MNNFTKLSKVISDALDLDFLGADVEINVMYCSTENSRDEYYPVCFWWTGAYKAANTDAFAFLLFPNQCSLYFPRLHTLGVQMLMQFFLDGEEGVSDNWRWALIPLLP